MPHVAGLQPRIRHARAARLPGGRAAPLQRESHVQCITQTAATPSVRAQFAQRCSLASAPLVPRRPAALAAGLRPPPPRRLRPAACAACAPRVNAAAPQPWDPLGLPKAAAASMRGQFDRLDGLWGK